MATIYDVAKTAGVSPKTVSRVLNADGPVGGKTRDAVEAAIQTLRYEPSNAARMMRSNKSGLVGLITGAISHSPEAAEPTGLPDLFIVQGLQKAISESGKTLMIADTGGESESVPHLIQTFRRHRVEGLIYVAEFHKKVALPDHRADCPIVLVNCYDDRDTPAVLPDDRAGQRTLVEALIRSGHQRIGFLTLDTKMDASGLRSLGYRDALDAHSLPFDPELETMGFEEGRELESGLLIDAVDRLLSLGSPPSVICCGNDLMALRVYGLLRSRGLRVPEDISVAGFDNYRSISETLYPPLTTVDLPYQDMGRLAAKALLSMIEGDVTKWSGPTLVRGPVAWRSSVTALNSISHFSLGRKRP